MKTKPNRYDKLGPELEYGLVSHCSEEVFGVKTDAGDFILRRADGCLLEPGPGDRVLCCLDSSGTGYVLSVLERTEKNRDHAQLALEGEVHIKARNGSLHLDADDELALTGRRLSLEAEEGRAGFSLFDLDGVFVNARVKIMNLFGESMNTLCERLSERLGSFYRHVETHEELQAGSSRHVAEGPYVIQARNTTVVSEKISKIDGEQVQLG
jgi:hypothetical protein